MEAPDLGKGIRIDDVADGAMITGRLGEDTILLARRGDEFFATDAFCTHYHGPLAEGMFEGTSVRCPWHHACFDLRTGRAERAPAMRPLRVFKVVRDGEVVRVECGGEAAAVESGSFAPALQGIVIVGAGAAGSFAAHELRRAGFGGRVTLLTREDRLPYDKPNLSKDYLAGRAPADWIPLRSEDEYASERIELRLGADVKAIDAAAREVRLAGGERIAYDRLILAPGAQPRRLEVPASLAHVHYLRTWRDADEIIASAANARDAVVIGASFIGLEAAASLRERGINVTVVGPEERPLERVLGREIGDFIRRTHESHGVRFRLGRKPVEIRANGVALDDGSVEKSDLVVIGVGVVPDLRLAEQAGLAIDRGIVVDEYLRTSDPNIFAAGDAARVPDLRGGRSIRVEHWVAAARQGQAAARNAIGLHERFDAVPFFWSQHYDLVLAYVGHAERIDDVEIHGSFDEGNAAAILREDGRVAAVVTLFRDDISLAAEAMMERGAGDEEIVREFESLRV